MWWLSGLVIVIGGAQLVTMVVHLRRLQHLAATQDTLTADWEHVMRVLRTDLDESISLRGRIAACNDASSTVEAWLNYGLGRTNGWRICATSGIAAGCALISTPGWGAFACFAWGLVSAAIAAWLGRRADSLASGIRGRWNGVIRSVVRSFPEDTAQI